LKLDEGRLKSLFQDLVPRVHSLEMLQNEFVRGDSILMVLEKVKAIEEA